MAEADIETPLQESRSISPVPAARQLAWYEQHEALCDRMLCLMAKAIATHTDEALRDVGRAHGELRRHARLMVSNTVPNEEHQS